MGMSSLVDGEELGRQIVEAESEVVKLATQLAAAQSRHRNLLNMRELARSLESDEFDPKVSPLAGATSALSTFEKFLRSNNWLQGSGDALDGDAGRKKLPSTQMIADVVNDSDRPLSREEAHEGFIARYGLPPTWENPANALNNALGRAVKNGLIEELNGRYMSRTVAENEEALESQLGRR